MPLERSATPLVTVVIRTIGRPSLEEAIDSVIAQTYRPIEILIVNASGETLPEISAGALPVRVVGGDSPLNRPQAANVGLHNARGELIGFLDDDDYFKPDHIDSLVGTLRRTPWTRVAYSGVLFVTDDKRPFAQMNRPFDQRALHEDNFIQMGAALFCRTLVAEGAAFDETMENYQDWDFWLQLSQKTQFVHTGKVTVCWRAMSGHSGSGLGPNADHEIQRACKQRVQAKWAAVRLGLAGG